MAIRSLAGKRIVVTGASSGIGRAIAIESVRRGAKVVANGRSEERLAETLEAARAAGDGEIVAHIGDVTEAAERSRLLHLCETTFGGLDVLVNNAGIGATGHFQYAGPERLQRIMDVNFFAPCELTREAIPMLKSGDDPAILFINSVAGRRAIPSRSEYSASKFALMGFSEALRAELSKDGIGVTVVNPGLTQSSFEQNMLENNARHSLHAQRSMSADEAAKQILDAVQSRRGEVTLTFRGKLLVLASRLFPRFVDFKMAKFVKRLYAKEQAAEPAAHAV